MQGPPAFHRRFQARLDGGTREFRGSDAAPDSFTSFKRSATAWDRDAGVARALDRAWGRARGEKKDTGPCNTRPTGSPVRAGGAPARPDPTPGDERAVIDTSPRSFPLRHSERGRAGRARQPPGPRRVGRRGTNLFSVEAETRTHLVASVESPYPPRATLSRVSRGERRRLRVYTPRRGPLLDRCRRLWLGGGRFRAIRRRPASTSQPRTHSARDAQMV